jgi:hypothetical protein
MKNDCVLGGCPRALQVCNDAASDSETISTKISSWKSWLTCCCNGGWATGWTDVTGREVRAITTYNETLTNVYAETEIGNDAEKRTRLLNELRLELCLDEVKVVRATVCMPEGPWR